MITFLKQAAFAAALVFWISGCASSVDVFAGISTDAEYSRVALSKLSEAVSQNPNAARFRVRWTLQKLSGEKIYPELNYDRAVQTLTESTAGVLSSRVYSPVSESTLQVLTSLHESPSAAIEHGASQQVLVDGTPYSPST